MPSRSRRAPADGKRGIHQDLTDDAMDWVLLFFASFGCLILLAGLNVIYKANATAAWPTTTGTIVSAAVQKSPAGKTYYWVPNICFRYQVDGVTYTSCRYSASSLTSFFLSGTAERIVARHPPGSHRVIAYPPFEPQRAILVPGARPVLSSAICAWSFTAWSSSRSGSICRPADMEQRKLRVGHAITPEQFEALGDEELARLIPRTYREYFPGKDACVNGHFYLHDGSAWSFFKAGLLDE